MEFTIDRSKWRSGNNGPFKTGKGLTKLLNKDGFMCCLGQVCKQLGVDDDVLIKCTTPSTIDRIEMDKQIRTKVSGIFKIAGPFSLQSKAIHINDSTNISFKNREENLKKLFKEFGHVIKFIKSPE